MGTWLLSNWYSLRTNFWFVPTLMVGAAVLLSILTLWFDHALGHRWIDALELTYSRGPEGARALLSTVSGSMVTIASLTFSITIVTLQLASTQFGPRLLRNFVGDVGNQVVLGTFIATFTYGLLILRTVNGTEQNEFVPHISVFVDLLLSVASLGVLIYFINHTASSIQAESVIASVAGDLHAAIDRLYPESLGRPKPHSTHPLPLPDDFESLARPVDADRSDYVQAIDGDRLIALASEHDLVLRVEKQPGDFVVDNQPLVHVYPASRLDDELAARLRRAFYLGSRRTVTQDAGFAIDQLVEVAVRALSPGINDPFTAMTCLDRLGAALSRLADREIPSPCRLDDAGRLRVVARAATIDDLVDAAFHQIRQATRSNAAVTLHLLDTIATVLPAARDTALRAALLRHAALVHEGSQDGLPDPTDRREADARYCALLATPSPSNIPNA